MNYFVNRILNFENKDLNYFIRNALFLNDESKEALELEDNEVKKRILAGNTVRQFLYETEDGFEERLNALSEEKRALLDEYLNFAAAYGMDVSRYNGGISLKGGRHKKLKIRRGSKRRRRRGSKRRRSFKKRRTSRR